MEQKQTLYKKIHAVMKDVGYLQKDDSVEYGKTKYKAISEEKVTSSVKDSLVKHGLVILPVEQEHLKQEHLTTVNTKYKIVDIDTGEYEILASSGTGVDTQDKGVGKAMTYAYKYLLLRTFAIPTGEDPDKISSDELTDMLKSSSVNKNSRQAKVDYKASNDQSNTEKVGQNHIAALCILSTEKGITEQQLKKVLARDYKISSKKDLTLKQFKELMERLKKIPIEKGNGAKEGVENGAGMD